MAEAVASSKQAYLVIAHKADFVFRTLIQMLDHPKNDIFIHMDAKTKSYDPAETEKLVKHSRIFHTKRVKVSWGGYSQVEAAMILLEAATSQGHYGHYHVISGQCLPIKTQDEIIAFFEEHKEAEFVSHGEKFNHEQWVRYYYPFKGYRWRRSILLRVITKICIIVQKIIGVHMNKDINFQKGADWISITDAFARYILGKRDWIKNIFYNTFMPCEMYSQTTIINSPFKNNLFREEAIRRGLPQHMRLIDWKRGKPYVFKMSDLEEIRNSPAMFARKI